MGNPIVNLYKKLPEDKKKLISDFLSTPKKMVRYCNELRFKVFEDQEKKFVYITSDEPDTGFIECFYPGATVTRVSTVYFWSLRKFVCRHDKVMIYMHPFLARFYTDDIISVPWIRQVLDLASPVEELLNKRSRRKEIEKVVKFQPVFSTDPADLDFFYEKLYLPYMKKWQNDAIILKKAFFKNDISTTGELCFLKKDDQIVAGQFCNCVRNSYVLITLGVTDEAYVKEGATAALYYYGIRRAQEKGVKYVDLGLSRPFIDDGVLNYKRKWGGEIQRDPENSHVVYLKNIAKDGLIVIENDKFKVLVSAENDACKKLSSGAGMEVKIRQLCESFLFTLIFFSSIVPTDILI
jgi:hypothetical protein